MPVVVEVNSQSVIYQIKRALPVAHTLSFQAQLADQDLSQKLEERQRMRWAKCLCRS